jgi:hypothetical protein
MRLLRLLVITATLISLPAYGLAATGHVRGCPERAPAGAVDRAMDGMAMDGMTKDGMAMPDDCCPGAAGQHAPEQHAPDQHSPDNSGGCAACQAGHTCKSAQGVQLVHAPILMAVPVHQAAMAGTAPRASLCSPDGLLRPPDLA